MNEALDVFCFDCGYDLRGLESGRCPECGAAFDRATLVAGGTRIPWERREQIGSIRAYLWTWFVVMTRPWRIARAVAGPVKREDARKFARVTRVIAFLGPAGLVAMAYGDLAGSPRPWPGVPAYNHIARVRAYEGQMRPDRLRVIGWVLDIGVLLAAWGGIWLFLRLAVAAIGLFFQKEDQPLEMRKRAEAVSEYASAPLVLVPMVMALVWLIVAQATTWVGRYDAAIVGEILLGGVWIWLWGVALAMLLRATHCGVGRMVVAGVALPIVWIGLGVVLLIGIPAAYALVVVMAMSLMA